MFNSEFTIAYDSSTHAKQWIFGESEFNELIAAHGNGSESTRQQILNYCCAWLSTLYGKCGLGDTSETHSAFLTGCIFLRRFFTVMNILDHDFELISLACLYLAGKVEELRWPHGVHGALQLRGFQAVHILRAAKIARIDVQLLLRAERLVMTELRFCFYVFRPIPTMEKNSDKEKLERIVIMFSDLILLHSPKLLGKAIILLACGDSASSKASSSSSSSSSSHSASSFSDEEIVLKKIIPTIQHAIVISEQTKFLTPTVEGMLPELHNKSAFLLNDIENELIDE